MGEIGDRRAFPLRSCVTDELGVVKSTLTGEADDKTTFRVEELWDGPPRVATSECGMQSAECRMESVSTSVVTRELVCGTSLGSWIGHHRHCLLKSRSLKIGIGGVKTGSDAVNRVHRRR